MDIGLTPSCRVNGSFTECLQLQSCSPSGCPIGYDSCITGECLPIAKFCDFIPDCPLRDDETNCDVANPFNSIKYDINSLNIGDHVLTLEIELPTAVGDEEKFKILKIDENLDLSKDLNSNQNIFLVIQRLVFSLEEI